jgi:hypothetical protein
MSEQLPELDAETLARAKVQLARQDCEQYGHQWRVIDVRTMADPAGTPQGTECTRCGDYHAVQSEASAAPAPPVAE